MSIKHIRLSLQKPQFKLQTQRINSGTVKNNKSQLMILQLKFNYKRMDLSFSLLFATAHCFILSKNHQIKTINPRSFSIYNSIIQAGIDCKEFDDLNRHLFALVMTINYFNY